MTVNPAPSVNWVCPLPVIAGDAINLSATTTDAATVMITSATSGNLVNTGSLATPLAIYVPTPLDIANGYTAFSVMATSVQGCEGAFNCQVNITGATYDYGDAPGNYDLEDSTVSIAAGSTILSGLYFGTLAPGTESAAKAIGIYANGDGVEEDGLISTTALITGDTATYQVRVTNNSAIEAYVTGFVDFDGNGTMFAAHKRSDRISITANSGAVTYDLIFRNFDDQNAVSPAYMRLRLSTDSDAVQAPFGASPQGEVEDHIVGTTTPLPLELSYFKCVTTGCNTLSSWNVASFNDVSRFILERSSNGQTFTETGSIPVKINQPDYQFIDANPGDGIRYYRLKLVKTDNKFIYSSIIAVRVDCAQEQEAISIYPSPSKSMITINSSKPVARVEIMSLSGQVLDHYEFNQQKVFIYSASLEKLATGVYMVRVTNENGKVYNQKIVKR